MTTSWDISKWTRGPEFGMEGVQVLLQKVYKLM